MKDCTKVLWLAVLTLIVFACKRESCNDPVPSLVYKSFTYNPGDSVGVLVFEFKDCDGDIGLSEQDINPPFDTGSDYYYNVLIDVYYMLADSSFEKYEYASDFGLNARVPILNDGPKKALEGVIVKSILPGDFPFRDTIYFEMRLIDRALNTSKPAKSDIIYLNQ